MPQEAPAVAVGSEIAMRAISLLGAPYKFGGAGPTAFDCSGLVRFVHWELGINVPRTAAEQFTAAKPVPLSAMAPGDLLFFRVDGKRISHVAIYAGEGRFIHAPQAGRPVEFRSIEDRFYRPRLAGVGRFVLN
jgi:cell wall-associated NlpC family hydrolase